MNSSMSYTQSPLRIDYDQNELLRMNLNENIVFPKNVMRSILAKCVDEYDPRIYPSDINEGESLILDEEIAKYCGCSSSSVAIGIGGDQLIDLIFRTFLNKTSDSVFVVSPTFSMYSIFASRQKSKLNEIWLEPSTSKDAFALPFSRLKDAWKKQSGAKLLVIVSPNNPTANQFPVEQIEEILEVALDKPVLLDEAYVEYAKYDAAKRLLKAHKNLIILRTFSKAFGLASLRLGYILSSDSEFIRRFNCDIQYPYPVTGLTLSMGIELLRRKEVVLEWVEKTKTFREELIVSLQKLGPSINVVPRIRYQFCSGSSKGSKKDRRRAAFKIRDRSKISPGSWKGEKGISQNHSGIDGG